ncbi:MAG: hypothetical protein IID40_02670 [Planctomycetes bacterium]|nr:hypothetical protein [Planctomycetota bacterium]
MKAPPTRRFRPLVVLVGLILAMVADSAWACSICYGDPDSDMGRGAVWGVAFLATVVAVVLLGMATTAACWIVKARRLGRLTDPTKGA